MDVIQLDKHDGESRNESEVKWSRKFRTDSKWDSVYIETSSRKVLFSDGICDFSISR